MARPPVALHATSLLHRLRHPFSRPARTAPWDNTAPIRAELFSVERLEDHARSLAAAQAVTARAAAGRPLATRLADNAATLLAAHRTLVKAAEAGDAITPAAEWLIDNYHLVERQIHEVITDLPPGYYRQLPKLAVGPFQGYPRVLGVAWAFVAHTDSRFDPETLCRYVRAYQQVQPLTVGELWALAITLRFVLIENLRRLAEATVFNRTARQTADALADRLLGAGERKAEPAAAVLAPHDGTPLPDTLAVQLVYRLRDQDPRVTPALTWLDQRLADRDTTVDAVVQDVHQRQGAASVTVRNIVTSMRLVSDVDWMDLVERVSLVDDVLAADGTFQTMDFPTRNLYRSAIETLARGSALSEIDIAHYAVGTAARGRQREEDGDRRGDSGYHLIAGGRAAFEAAIGYRPPLRRLSSRLNQRLGLGGYGGAIVLITAVLLAAPLLGIAATGLSGPRLALLGALGAIPAIDAAVAIVNRLALWGFGAALLPALELRHGVPATLRTLVAVPSLLSTPRAVEDLLEQLEVHHLANPEDNLHFALLTDWLDADGERAEGDDVLLANATAGIDRLNGRYGPVPGDGGPRFLLLHRRRVWNAGEGRWMGWERKRGKLHELNRLLRGDTATTFVATDGQIPTVPTGIRYVLTLDADTRLPRDTVRRLIGKMAHPLNRPRFDARAGRVVEGYAVMQPRVTPALPIGREGSLFQRAYSGIGGIDPYAGAVSDVYQDLFGEGSYAGKGIYEVDAFEAALAGRVPDSTLLSHDLFEGVYARAGLASDIEVVEEFPARYDVAAQRDHRWARGDWQLLPWILGLGRAPGTVPILGRWKMIDNLRRTLTAPLAVAALLAGWTLPFPDALAWTAFMLVTLLLPPLVPLLGAVLPRHGDITLRSHLRALAGDLRLALTLSALQVTFLAHRAWLMADAIGRTLGRLFVTRRHLLEWVTAAQAADGPRPGRLGFYRRMAAAPALGVVAIGAAWLSGQGTEPLAAAFAVLWLASPAIAHRISLSPRMMERMALSAAEAGALRRTARRTWRFFERFVTAADHMLPPDNFQEDPAPVLAHRTSPTNLGLYLLSVASARDFGWLGSIEAVERLEATLATMASLSRFRGHFYNWYDTQDRRPLDPPYISSVDSGNLAGHLIALANAVADWRRAPLADARRLSGIMDALDVAGEEIQRLDDRGQGAGQGATATRRHLDAALAALTEGLARSPLDGETLARRLADLAAETGALDSIASTLDGEQTTAGEGLDMLFWVGAVQRSIASHRRDLDTPDGTVPEGLDGDLTSRLSTLEETARAMALAMDFEFLLDRERMLLSIGYLVPEGTLDPSCYDLLASEARLASFLAIAKGDVPARHWFRLGRTVTPVAHGAALISWSGSMFEYLMPSLVMRAPAGSLIEQTSRLIVRRQQDYAATRNVPWGVSESAYNARDLEFTYQYSNFGVPSLGLKRGLGDSTVIAPYATALATMVDPAAAARNLALLARVGARGRYGYYEALDYTAQRLPQGHSLAIVRAYMAHHQGMTIVAIADTLLDGLMRTRFHAEPMVKAAELLLQERTPRDVAIARPLAAEATSGAAVPDVRLVSGRRLTSPHGASPAAHLLSNGQYGVMITAAGSGYSRWRDLAVTRWREDATCDDWGSYIFLRDVASETVWSAAFQPSGAEPDAYEVAFKEDRAEFTRRDGSLTTTLDVLVSGEDAGEVRRVSLYNTGERTREIEVTSYAELVLAPQAADMAHPAFSKLFVQTEYLPEVGAILATRRRRTPMEPEVWAAHMAVVEGDAVGKAEIETDRARFLGRGREVRAPGAVVDGRPLSNTTGTVLDPIFALRRRVRVLPGGVTRIAFWTLVAPSRDAVLDLADAHRDITAFDRTATLAWTQAQVQLHHLGIDPGEAGVFQRLAGHLLHAAPTLRPSSDTIRRGAGGQAGLWPHGISGDLPLLLLRITETDELDLARQVLRAHEYWRMKQFAVDVVILNERGSSYVQDLQVALEALTRSAQARPKVDVAGPSGQVFLLRADLMPTDARALLLSVARVVLAGWRGPLSDQLDQAPEAKVPARPPPRRPDLPPPSALTETTSSPPAALEFFNGLGGFADGGREYVTILGPGQSTPAPWINVIANPAFGFQVSTDGGGYTWSVSSRENQITPWSNDPVTDRPGEALYLRDDDSGALWSPLAQPIRERATTYTARHGWGYSRFQHTAHGLAVDLVQFVPLDDPVKITRLRLHDVSGRPRRLSLTAYVQWVLGPSRSGSAPFVMTEIDPGTGALFARNRWNAAFGARVAFIDLGGRQTDWTGDRREFIGRNGTLANPAALGGRAPLSNTVGAGLDPCGALRAPLALAAHGTVDVILLLGEAADAEAARDLVARYRATDPDAILAGVEAHWAAVLGAVQVKTPDRALDIMLNGWLLYQTLACRVWARSAFYQSSGAYGFRDQLQDGMALVHTRPALTRDHLLRAAGRQFIEGDVQHWWLPHSGQGVRTRISDDRVWLAHATAHYVAAAGDAGILDVTVPFLEGPRLAAGEHDIFFAPTISDTVGTLFDHCARGLDDSLALGAHGLPLIGTGDWNDGMNRVGEDGRGESVWLAWLLYATLTAFAPLADARGDSPRATAWRAHATGLQDALEREAWDGGWYRRGWFDDGTPLGSAASQECRIDAIAQSWAVLSGAAPVGRAAHAMAAVGRHLILPNDKLALLFTPPFDQTPQDPGYIKGYPPGIRENGGQYTHAAAWSVLALAALGQGGKAMELLSLLNPINHSLTRADAQRYKVEPYVVAADIYAVPPHLGRGGWTWYTGSAGWMQRAGMEGVLGLRIRGAVLHLDPCIPGGWPGFDITLRHGGARYHIRVDNPDGVERGVAHASLDGTPLLERPLRLPLVDDAALHQVRIRLG
ncbi:GH36-type glycosyl hydrolase domain-containing protein [Nitrospirillum iridis]|uniref:Cyclic beta-1,2-glucan synthetase n=1 Tax=Nitrospirillum iridis TaxID=765888 RepID=A0A7X0EDJ4_9PROT|nr:glucoamylase family protein [Nitrospirillum iridis]MBB6251101.1 cyclic beta-1,2-glucan synthetase [Nitrospirillum iridis]